MLAVAGQIARVVLAGALEGFFRVQAEALGEGAAEVEEQLVVAAEFLRNGFGVLEGDGLRFLRIKTEDVGEREAALMWCGWAGLTVFVTSTVFVVLAGAAFAFASSAPGAGLAVFAISRTSSKLKAIGLAGFFAPRMRLRSRSRALALLDCFSELDTGDFDFG